MGSSRPRLRRPRFSTSYAGHRLCADIRRAEKLKKQFDSQNAAPSPTAPAEFAAFVMAKQAKWGPVADRRSIRRHNL
jgi:hypothetical protein